MNILSMLTTAHKHFSAMSKTPGKQQDLITQFVAEELGLTEAEAFPYVKDRKYDNTDYRHDLGFQRLLIWYYINHLSRLNRSSNVGIYVLGGVVQHICTDSDETLVFLYDADNAAVADPGEPADGYLLYPTEYLSEKDFDQRLRNTE